MNMDETIDRLIDSYRAYYNVFPVEESELKARCEFYQSSEKFVISKKAELWKADNEEFLYLYAIDNLSLTKFEEYKNYVLEDGMKRAHIGPGHMYTYITPVIVCNKCDEDALKALKKSRVYKSFRFSFHGWMDFHTAVVELDSNTISSNYAGRFVKKGLRKVLYKK